MLRLNPFARLIEENTVNPYSRTLRTPFFEKMKDTYRIIAGDYVLTQFECWKRDEDDEHAQHVTSGLLDYVCMWPLFILIAIADLVYKAALYLCSIISGGNYLQAAIYCIIFPYLVCLVVSDFIIRPSIAILLTLALSPVVALCAAISYGVRLHIERNIRLEIDAADAATDDENARNQNFFAYMGNPDEELTIANEREQIVFRFNNSISNDTENQQVDEQNREISYSRDEVNHSRFFSNLRYINDKQIGEKIDRILRPV